jgi:acetoin utilization deacetylase AcuC-like enzyme
MSRFALYLHPEVVATSRPIEQIRFIGHSVPHFSLVRETLQHSLSEYRQLSLREADYEEYGRVHTTWYLQTLQLMAADQIPERYPKLSLECRGYEYCLPGYQYGLGGLIEAIYQVKSGTLERAYCFSLGGHHAYANHGHGYCLLNPQAAAVRFAQSAAFPKILIVDWDIHHGDGTQSIFAHDSSVFCISIHSAVDLYMAKVAGIEIGTTTGGEAVGQCNIPLLGDMFDDAFAEKIHLTGKFYRAHESLTAFQSALDTIPWKPDLIFIFSGYDSHKDDCGEGITDWGNEDFRLLTQFVLEKAKQVSCPVISSHGGGYNLPITVAATISHVDMLANYR